MKFLLELDYQANKLNHKLYIKAEYMNSHFKIKIDDDANKLIITLIPIDDIKINSVKLVMNQSYQSSDMLFGNGYQSWSNSFEYPVLGHVKSLKTLPKFLIKKFAFESYGDYRFYNYKSTQGVIRSNNYTYVRRMDELELFGSLNERVGYTIFEHDTTTSKLNAYKDLEGVKFSRSVELFNIVRIVGKEEAVFDEYFRKLNIIKPTAKKLLGYTSWYNFYQNINEEKVLENIKSINNSQFKFDVFQIDDGFETFVGDWFSVDSKKFPKGLKPIVEEIHQDKMLAGIWLAPFAMEEKSDLFKKHPDWAIRNKKGELIKAGANWSGFYGLNFSLPAVKQYVSDVLDYYQNELGFDLFKLDFLYAVNFLPYNNQTRANIMYEAMEFLRNKLKDKLILGCGVNLFTAAGLVDYCRVSCDVSLKFDDKFYMRILHQERNSTKNAIKSSIYRHHLNNRAFLNDPDVFLLRDDNNGLNLQQKAALLKLNSIFGSVLFTSDNVNKYGETKMQLLKEAINIKATKIVITTINEVITIEYLDNNQKIQVLNYDSNVGRFI